MKKINLAISGCMGRMGQQLIKSSKKNKNFKLVTLTENRLINKKFNGVKPELNSEKAFRKADVIIDFTIPNCTLEILKIASKLRKKVVIGTTGFTRAQENQISQLVDGIEDLTGKSFNSDFRTNLVQGASEVDLVRSGLEDTMRGSYDTISKVWNETKGVPNLRTAAMMVAVKRVVQSYSSLGI